MSLYEKKNARSRWASFENPRGLKGQAAQENRGAKGHAFDSVGAGETVTLMETGESGVVRRIWMTVSDRTEAALRALVLRMYWDGETRPAVECPLADFHGHGLAALTPFENELFASPEGRSFNCFVPMPFLKGAVITLTNEGAKPLKHLFYDVDYTLEPLNPKTVLYFHAWWNRSREYALGEDLEILPKVTGGGRFLGMSVGLLLSEAYRGSWWGEGEVKVYLDGDGEYPTMAGTGVEDYIGTAWGQSRFVGRTQGSLEADMKAGRYTFYRLHTVDPIWFDQEIRVTLQTLGGAPGSEILKMIEQNAAVKVISSDGKEGFRKLNEDGEFTLTPESIGEGDPWYNFYRKDDYAWTAYFYLDRPVNELPEIPALPTRVAGMQK